MATVETVTGPVDVDTLGATLMHEHVFVVSTEYVQNYGAGAWWDEEARISDAVAKLRTLPGAGIRTIVDPTVLGLGRYIPRIQRIAAEVPDLNIVVATGVYAYVEAPHLYGFRGPGRLLDDGGPDPMALDFIRDLTVGIADTGVKAAFLKCAVDEPGLVPDVERICRAVAHAHRETGAPICVHTHSAARTGEPVIELFRAEGVDLGKVVVAHAGDSNDLDYLMALADTGATLGMDRFGLDLYNSTADRVATVAALVDRGYADRMVLSHDTSCFMDWFGAGWDELRPALAPDWHYRHISDEVLPALRAAGVGGDAIDLMMTGNPRRYFTPASR
jgi:phosphotriesterase-related protein